MSKELQLSNLPRDVIFDILSRLPIKALIQFTCVSKASLPLISHPHFIKLHFSRSTNPDGGATGAAGRNILLYYESIDYRQYGFALRCPTTLLEQAKLKFPFKSVHGYFRIVGSSNGLVCLFDTNYFTHVGIVFFWNPSVKRFMLVRNSHSRIDTLSHTVVGFGFVPKLEDYKVVKILYDLDTDVKPEVLVYSLSSDSWRKIDAFPPCFVHKRWADNVFVKGCVHWLAYSSPKVNNLYDSIMSFDLSTDQFREIELPERRGMGYEDICLCPSVSGDSLCLFFRYRQLDTDRWELWIKKDFEVSNSWTKKFNVVLSAVSNPICLMENDDVLLVLKNGMLMSYNAKVESVRDYLISGTPGSFRLVNYVSSLVLLDCKQSKIVR